MKQIYYLVVIDLLLINLDLKEFLKSSHQKAINLIPFEVNKN